MMSSAKLDKVLNSEKPSSDPIGLGFVLLGSSDPSLNFVSFVTWPWGLKGAQNEGSKYIT